MLSNLIPLIGLVLAAAVVSPADAAPKPPISDEALQEAIHVAKAAEGMLGKEVSVGCVASPLPTSVTGAAVSANVRDELFVQLYADFSMTAWRVSCSDGDKQLLLTLAPRNGSSNVPQLFSVVQGSQSYNTALIASDTGATYPGTITGPTTGLLRSLGGTSNTFDDDAALTIRYIGLSLGGKTDLLVPAADAGQTPTPPQLIVGDQFDGAYYDPGMSGQGFFLDVVKAQGVVAGSWFTYDPSTRQRQWFTFVGPIDGENADVQVYRTDGGEFLRPTPVTDTAIGSAQIEFADCTHIVFTFDIPSLGTERTLLLDKVTPADESCIPR
ncbi:MAG: hypothetical protein KDK91_33725 [Gammaproteobacteria bacterium]|nr:hypothetical protein [Gammaproteobacteria bacterium]